jgi:hypothetical protein
MSIALISSVASLLVAMVSLLTAILTNRNSSRTAESLERLKHSLARSSRTLEVSDSEVVASLEALKIAMQAIQRMKDEIQLILNAYGNSLNTKEALERIEAARQNLFKIHEEKHPFLSENEALVLHRAKNTALKLSQYLTDDLQKKKYASDINNDTKEAALGLRTDLTEAQNLLRDYRTERLIDLSASA